MLTPYITKLFGKVLIELEEIDSTNSYASRLLSKTKPEEGTVIFTYYQSRGKGQIGNKWLSARGKNILISMITYPVFLKPVQQFLLSQAFSLGICDMLNFELKGMNIYIKWPNDIYVDNRKIAGILIENAITSDVFLHSICGIGLNVNQAKFNTSIPNPTSMLLESGKSYNLFHLLAAMLQNIEKRYFQLKNKAGQENIKREYLNYLYLYQTNHCFKLPEGITEGVIQGVNEYGQLAVRIDGKLRYFNFKEIIY